MASLLEPIRWRAMMLKQTKRTTDRRKQATRRNANSPMLKRPMELDGGGQIFNRKTVKTSELFGNEMGGKHRSKYLSIRL